MEATLTFSVCYRTPEGFLTEQFEQLEYDTVENLKISIHQIFGIPPHRQIIDGWRTEPENDQSLLQICTDLGRTNYLFLRCRQEESIPTDSSFNAQENERDCMEIRAVKSCIRKISTHITASSVRFNMGKLSNIKDTVLLAPPLNRKFVVLYMHNSREEFSTTFLTRYLRDEEISKILNDYFCIIGWDVENRAYHSALCKAVEDANFGNLSALIQSEACAAVIIQNINGFPNILSFLIGDEVDSSRDSFLLCLQNCRDYLIVDRMLANGLDGSSQSNEMTSEAFQKIMADRLGDRDYDSFAFDEHDLLKKKIGFAIFGPPGQETGNGYDKAQNSQIEHLFNSILKHNNLYAEYQDQVELAFIYVVLEPTEKQATDRMKQNPNYNPRIDISPIPIFVLRKCRQEEGEACRIFIDHNGRVYSNWQDYLKNNKLSESIMVLPLNGRYEVEDGTVLLEKHETPSCGVLNTVLRVGDISSMVAGLGSGFFMLAGAAASAIVPPVVIGAGITAGVYSVTRSAFGLADKYTHDENLSIFNSEARGIYINILAGSLGFVGAGANMAVSQLISRGVNIGQGVGLAVNALSVANIGISGIGIINSSYDVFDMWINHKQAPSALTILQLASSVLFFGNAVYNFRTVGQMIDETQGRVLEDYYDSLRSNRHRKTFDKLMKETIRQNDGNQVQGRAEVIKTIRNIGNKDDVFAALTRNNKLMNRNGIRFSANGGEITLNGQPINMNEFIGMNREHASAFLSNLPRESHITMSDTNSMIDNFSLNNWSIPNVQVFAGFALTLISKFSNDIQGMIMELVQKAIDLLFRYFRDVINETFGSSAHQEIMIAVMEYFAGQASTLLQRYSTWRSTGNPIHYESYFVEVPVEPSERYTWIFSRIVKICHEAGESVNNIKEYLEAWLLNTIYTRQLRDEAIARRDQHSSRNTNSVCCTICRGRYFTQS
ncbi:uncharacterized protein LOC126889339 isoform X2 [Diabrotica virgifera virgifera]|uniref:DUF4781 domain-containing protein n=1 Tax=Diabrotica virgifera virgifera TaxID=50390 RepID=A0ABM5KTL6_DIAVI|nr:uncharacterized protein LOC126889339 isoform X2 [Diabrotica virgifera virgifera]XP_050513532.1 uncharacterized protein LOC126889339 isoform X2 [Diabrotica virgifera virgifera]